jgi:hypothetical protein
MDTITTMQCFELIDIAAHEGRVFHYNGGQAYVKISNNCQALMIIDHTGLKPNVEIMDGSIYFKECKGMNVESSRRLVENGSLAQWHYEQKQKVV